MSHKVVVVLTDAEYKLLLAEANRTDYGIAEVLRRRALAKRPQKPLAA